MPAAIASAGLRRRIGAPPTATLPASSRSRAEDRLRQFGASGADQAGQPDHLAERTAQAHVRAACGCVRPATDSTTGPERLRGTLEQIGDRPSDHQPHDLRLVQLGGGADRHQAAVAQHGDRDRRAREPRACGARCRSPRRLRRADCRITPNRRRASSSVSDDVGSSSASRRTPARSARMISSNCRCAAPRSPARVQGDSASLQPELRQHRPRALRELRRSRKMPPMRESSPTNRFSAIDRSAKMSGSWWMTRMPAACASAGERNATARAVHGDAAGVRLVHALDHAHQRRFAGAVLAHQGQHLAGPDVERHVGERLHHAEPAPTRRARRAAAWWTGLRSLLADPVLELREVLGRDQVGGDVGLLRQRRVVLDRSDKEGNGRRALLAGVDPFVPRKPVGLPPPKASQARLPSMPTPIT